MNSRALVVWFLLLTAVFAVTVDASIDDKKQAGENQVENSKSPCKYGNCEQVEEIPFVEAGEVLGGEEEESKYSQGGRGGQGGGSGHGGHQGGGSGQGGYKGGGGGTTRKHAV
ncbi:PREDICTED: glycine-rich cell wall structural protein-like [Camelina sativa]|uniref:Glycine-rich cell wall structural protein-like n=1 Tax=Camelina sativa TaxID=90675 RepID=A0ABM0XP24_CAMSA|nr:PREDICTED: glycine-rich cell wall structural protein-like [Camelina sativa]